MTTTPSLSNALQQEHQLITSLLDILKEEQDLLVNADTDSLAALTPRKSDLIQQLAASASQRHQQLAAAGFPAEEAGMGAYLAAIQDEQATRLWEELLEHTRAAKELNRVNGMLIGRQMAHNQTVIAAMKLAASDTDATTYGPSGQTSGAGPSQRFVVG